jgi:hypothetical protein
LSPDAAIQRSDQSVPVGRTDEGATRNNYLNQSSSDVWKKKAASAVGFSQSDDRWTIAVTPPPSALPQQQQRPQERRSFTSLRCHQSSLTGQPLSSRSENQSDVPFNRAVGEIVGDTEQEQVSRWDSQETTAQRQLALQDSAIVRSGRVESVHSQPGADRKGPNGQANTWAERRYAAQGATEGLYAVHVATAEERYTVQAAAEERYTVQASAEERYTVQAAAKERYTVQAAAKERYTVQVEAEERYTVQPDILSWLAAKWAETANQLAESHLVWPHKVVYYQPTC